MRLPIAGLLLCVAVLVGIAFGHPTTCNNATAVYTYTSNSPLTTAQSGSVITNFGAGGAVTFDLPDAVKGLYYIVTLAAAQDVNVNPQSGDRIWALTDGDGDAISSDATVRTTGTWSDAN
jgi:hypothetical protein